MTVRANQVITKVHELIDPVSGEWEMNCLFVRISGLLMRTAFFKSQSIIRRWKTTSRGISRRVAFLRYDQHIINSGKCVMRQPRVHFSQVDLHHIRCGKDYGTTSYQGRSKNFYGGVCTMLSHVFVSLQTAILAVTLSVQYVLQEQKI